MSGVVDFWSDRKQEASMKNWDGVEAPDFHDWETLALTATTQSFICERSPYDRLFSQLQKSEKKASAEHQALVIAILGVVLNASISITLHHDTSGLQILGYS